MRFVGGIKESEHLLDLVRHNLMILVLDLLLNRRPIGDLFSVYVFDLCIVLFNSRLGLVLISGRSASGLELLG